MSTEINWKLLQEAAKAARTKSYSPYSGQSVGAAILVKSMLGDEIVFSGCNVENGSYTSTVCAEVNAITTAVATLGPDFEIIAFAVYGDRKEWASPQQFEPCGNCRSVIYEFAAEDCLMSWSPQPVKFSEIFKFLS